MNLASVILRFIIGLLVLTISAAGGITYMAWQYVKEVEKKLPSAEKLITYQPIEPTQILSKDGQKIGEIFTERRYPLEYKDMNPMVVNAFVAAEDMRFFEHIGVDFNGLARAGLRFLSKSNGPVQGGSTITQQLAKNLLLTREKTVERKVKDILLAMRVEKILPKEKILELYLNTLFLGNNSYGIEAAARNYFRKSSSELSLAEASLIAGLAPAPSTYSPVENQQKAKVRQRFVLDQLLKMGKINLDQANSAYAQPLRVFRAESPNVKAAPYFFSEVKKQLDAILPQGSLAREGYSIHTTIDMTLQQEAQRIVQEKLLEYENKKTFKGPSKRLGENFDVALRELINQPQNDDETVLAIATQSFPELGAIGVVSAQGIGLLLIDDHKWLLASAPPIGTTPEDSFATILKPGDVVQVKRILRKTPKRLASNMDRIQSLSKYLSYFSSDTAKSEIGFFELTNVEGVEASALVANSATGEVLAMVGGHDFAVTQFNRAAQAKRQVGSSVKPLYYSMALDHGFSPASLLDSPPIVIGDWRPENYTKEFTGRATLRRSLVQSYNIQSIQLAQALGLRKCSDHFAHLGLDWDAKNGGLSLALGSGSATLVQMAQSYTPFVNEGRIQELHYISKIVDRKGQEMYSWEKNSDKLSAVPVKIPKIHEPEDPEAQNKSSDDAPVRFWKYDATHPKQVISPAAAFVMYNLLQDVVKFGTGTAAQGASPYAAGKTGTTNNYTDAWFLGVLPGFVGGVWVGFDDATKSMGTNAAGGKVAAPFWREIMKKVAEIYPIKPLAEPPGVRWVKVDPNTGKLSASGTSVPVIDGTEPGSPGARNALGVLGVDSNADSPSASPEETDTSALRSSF